MLQVRQRGLLPSLCCFLSGSLKAKIYCWRITNDIIPTKYNLANKGFCTNQLCVFCRKHEESANHIWSCLISTEIWSRIIFIDLDVFGMTGFIGAIKTVGTRFLSMLSPLILIINVIMV